MMKMSLNKFMLLLLLIGGLTASLYAQEHQVNISGATLFADFFHAPASTNDYIDVDGDGLAEIITGAGPSGAPHVRVFNSTGTILQSYYALDTKFSGGVNVGTILIKN